MLAYVGSGVSFVLFTWELNVRVIRREISRDMTHGNPSQGNRPLQIARSIALGAERGEWDDLAPLNLTNVLYH